MAHSRKLPSNCLRYLTAKKRFRPSGRNAFSPTVRNRMQEEQVVAKGDSGMRNFTKMVRRLLAVGILVLGVPHVVDAQDEAPQGIRNYTRVNATVACGGATPPEALADLKRLGFTSVINFRTAQEEGAAIEASQNAASDAGLKYFHIPFRTPSDEIAAEFLGVIEQPSNQPVYIHCASANRVGAMWFIKRVKQDGWDDARAMEEAEAIGLRSEALKEFARGYVSQ